VLVCVLLLQLVELRARNWRSDSAADQFYNTRRLMLAHQQVLPAAKLTFLAFYDTIQNAYYVHLKLVCNGDMPIGDSSTSGSEFTQILTIHRHSWRQFGMFLAHLHAVIYTNSSMHKLTTTTTI